MRNDEPNYITARACGCWGFFAILFIILKLVGFVDWNWEWVLLPVWGPPLVDMLIIVGQTGVDVFKHLFQGKP